MHYFKFDATAYTQLIPYLFGVVEQAEKSIVAGGHSEPSAARAKSDSHAMEVESGAVDDDDQTTDSQADGDEKLYRYIQVMCIDCLLTIYKLNKPSNNTSSSSITSHYHLDQSMFNIELLMQMLHVNSSDGSDGGDEPEDRVDRVNVQERILLLLSEVAAIFPDKVLEHVIIMFVFVGNKLTRKDDAYSFQVITKTIGAILPAIVNNNQLGTANSDDPSASSSRLTKTPNVMQRHQKQLPYVSSLVCKILQSFVVALPHIPAHRKAIIFTQLLDIIGLDDYLWITIVQSIDHYLVQSVDLLDFTNSLEQLTTSQRDSAAALPASSASAGKRPGEKKVRDTLKAGIQAMISLHVQLPPAHLIQSSIYLIAFLNKYLTSLFDKAIKLIDEPKQQQQQQTSSSSKQIYSHLACQLDNYSLLQMKYLAYNLLTFVSELLTADELIGALASLYEDKSSAATNELFQMLLERILMLIFKLSQALAAFDQRISRLAANATSNESSGGVRLVLADLRKFHKAIVNKTYDLMERAISLFDSKQFIHVVQRLLKHDLFQIRRRVLVLLNNKLRKYEPSEHETTLLIGMIDDLLGAIKLDQLTTTSTAIKSKDKQVRTTIFII